MSSFNRMQIQDFSRLVEQLSSKKRGLMLYARQWLDAESTEDVMQEALVSLFSQSTPPDAPIAWMYRTVRNAAIDHAKISARRKRRERRVAQDRREWFDATPETVIDGPIAQAALEQLPSELREPVVLRIWGGLAFAQISQVLSIGISTAHLRYVTGLKRLRHQMENPCPKKTN